ncbi:MAG: exodeoxyribonuclease VII small subunit [Pseudomonadota bacterium]
MAKKLNLEEALTELEGIVGELEAGELSLDDAMKRFERGVKLTRDCQSALSVAEQKVETLLADAGLDDDPLPFEPEED